MSERSYSYLDIAVMDAVRARFAEGDCLVILSRSLDEVLWANGHGARLLGAEDVFALVGADPKLPLAARRQIEATSGYPEIGSNRMLVVRLGSGLAAPTVNFAASDVEMPDGERAILLATPAPASGRDPLVGLDGEGRHLALLDAEGMVVSASEGFAGAGISRSVLAGLAMAVRTGPDRLVKRMVPGQRAPLPAGLARLSESPVISLLMVLEEIEPATSPIAEVSKPTISEAPSEKRTSETNEISAVDTPSATETISEQQPDEASAEPITESNVERDETSAARKPDTELTQPASPHHKESYFTSSSDERGATGKIREADLPAAPIRFVWRIDADGRFDHISPEFAAAFGPEAADVIGRRFTDVAQVFDLDPDGEIASLLERRDTWSGRSVLWPVAGTDLKVPVDLAALPAYGRDRGFEGYRGFGVARMGDAMIDPEAIGLALRPAGAPPRVPAPIEAEPANHDPFAGEVPALTTSTTPGRRESDKIIRLAERRGSPRDLSSAERQTFREIGERLQETGVERADTSPNLATPSSTSHSDGGSTQDIGTTAAPVEAAPLSEPVVQPIFEAFEAEAAIVDFPSEPASEMAEGASETPSFDAMSLAVEPDLPDLPDLSHPTAEDVAAFFGSVEDEGAEYDHSWVDSLGDEPVEKNGNDNVPAFLQSAQSEASSLDEFLAEPETSPTGNETFAGLLDEPDESIALQPVAADTETAITVALDTSTEPELTAEVPAQAHEDVDYDHSRELEIRSAQEPALYAAKPDLDALTFETAPGSEIPDPVEHDFADAAAAGDEPFSYIQLTPEEPEQADETTHQTREEIDLDEPQNVEIQVANEADVDLIQDEPDGLPPQSDFKIEEFEPVQYDLASVAAESSPNRSYVPSGVFLPSAFAGQLEERAPGVDTALLSRLPLPMLIHSGDTLHYANREFLQLTGYPSLGALEAAGGLETLFGEPDEATRNERSLRLRTNGGDEVPVDAFLQSVAWENGKALLLSLRPAQQVSAVATATNVTPHATAAQTIPADKTNEDLAARLEELRAIIDTATDGVVLIENDGLIRSISHPAEALFGEDSADVAGRHFVSLFAIESQKAARDYLEGLSGTGVASVLNDGREVIGREAKGRFIPLFMTIGKLPADNGFCAVVRDITQWKRAEEELTQARLQAERASSQKTDFLARVSHEIRTPLNAIIGFSELMLDEKFGPITNDRYRDYLRDINKSGNHVLDLVNDLLDISKIEAGQLEMNYEAVSLNEALSEAIAMMQPQANRERVIIRSSLVSRLPEVVADLRSVKQIALNLLANAIRYTPAGGQVIVSTTYESGGDIVMRVRDTGIGMAPAEIEQALKPFKQINALKRARGDGTGLGLPLTKALVEANRARFAIHSTPGEGTLVEILFPSTRVLAH